LARPGASNQPSKQQEKPMSTVTTQRAGTAMTLRDGTEMFYKDWGSGQPVVFCHGWPLNADAFDDEGVLVASNGYRAVAHDRRGHGRSGQSWSGNDMDTYADDLAELIEALDLEDAILVGHSTGGGEVARYIGRHSTDRVAKAVLLSAVPPVMIQSETNPDGVPRAVFDEIRDGVSGDRSQYYKDLSAPFYGANRPGSTVSQGTRDAFWLMSMQCGLPGALDCITAFSETDFSEDLAKFDIPTLVAHGDDDQIVPIDNAGRKTAKLVRGATLKVYPGAPHGLTRAAHEDEFHADLLAFMGA
jgi:non-heme chloroperoxidase